MEITFKPFLLLLLLGIVTVIKMEGPPLICKTDEVGEICVHSAATGSQYWGLQGLTNNNFKVLPLQAENQLLGDVEYARSGLLGFLGPGNLVFVCGSRDGLMTVTGRKHNADDIIATVLAVEPMKFIYRGRIAVFSVRVLRDERICVVAEQRPDCSEEEVIFSAIFYLFFIFMKKYIQLLIQRNIFGKIYAHICTSIFMYLMLFKSLENSNLRNNFMPMTQVSPIHISNYLTFHYLELSMDVPSLTSRGLHPRCWHLLLGIGTTELSP
jgi:acyl-CoA synthetase (AMP-forming)/AMP-acid ligase II